MKRAPLRAWIVTGPVGRFTGFWLEFARAMWDLRKSRTR